MAGRGRGKTLPAWMTSGDASLSSSVPPAASTTVPGQFNDARQPFVDKFQAPQRDAPSTGQFQSSSSNNGREQYAAPSTFGSREPFQAPSIQRDAAPHHGGAGQGGPGPAPPQGPPPRAMPGRYDMTQTNPTMMPPRPAMQMGQDYTSGKLPFIPQMSLAQGVGAGIAPMMGFQQPPHQLQQQLQQPQHLQPQQQLQQSHMFMPPHQQSMQQSLQQPIPLQMSMQMQMQNPSMPGMGMGMPLQQPALSSVGRGLPLQQPGALPLGMSLGGFPQPVGRGMPLALPRGPAPAPAPVAVGDPNNEVSSWSEHEAEDKRKYWYNRVSGTSTYDKPFCLKTPEERSIPPCKWKEYTAADGKKYYSDGKESSWSVPEEYRVWKEKMDAVERKKLIAFAPSGSANVHTSLTKTLPTVEVQSITAATFTANTATASTAASVNGSFNSSSVNNTNGGANASSGSNNRKKQVEEEEKVVIVYATQEEAVEAFKSMLTERRVLTTMKMKEVIDLCQSDPRFNALKSGGEKKQALAEYQTKTLKIEKEAQKSKARKSRDAFLLMLAENTGIDIDIKWRSAILLLQDDSRYKNVEDPNDREDLFNDFVSELRKKVQEDKAKHRDNALKLLNSLYEELQLKNLLNRRSSWSDEKDGILKLTRGPEYRILEDIEVKRAFQDFVSKLEKIYRDEERIKKQELQKKIDESSKVLKESFEKLVFDGLITPICRWKDWVGRPEVTDNSHYQVIESLVSGKNEKDKNENTNVDANKRSERTDRIDRNEKYDSMTASMTNTCRNLFENVLDNLSDNYKLDKRLIKDVLEEKKYVITHDSTYAEFSAILLSVAGAKSASVLTSERTEQEDYVKIKDNNHNNGTKDKEREKDKYSKSDDKEKSSGRKEKDFQKSVENMIELRPKNPLFYFTEIHDKVFASYEEDRIRMKRKEDKYIALLQEFYNRSDHVGTEWEDAKEDLASYSEYSNLGRTDRKRLFQEYMTNLDGIMQAKTRSLHDSMLSEVKKSELENIQKEKDQDKEHDTNHNQDIDNDEEAEIEKNDSNDHDDKDREMEKEREGGSGRERERERDDDYRDLKKHRTHRDADEKDRERDRDRDYRGKDRDREEGEERERGDDSRSKDKLRDTDKRRGDTKDRDGEKNDVRKRDKDDYEEEGEEDEDGEDDGKKGKKRKKERSAKDKNEKDKKHKKHKKDDK